MQSSALRSYAGSPQMDLHGLWQEGGVGYIFLHSDW